MTSKAKMILKWPASKLSWQTLELDGRALLRIQNAVCIIWTSRPKFGRSVQTVYIGRKILIGGD